MTEKQREAIRNFNKWDLLEMYNNYYRKITKELVMDAETTEIFDALRAEILRRMEAKA